MNNQYGTSAQPTLPRFRQLWAQAVRLPMTSVQLEASIATAQALAYYQGRRRTAARPFAKCTQDADDPFYPSTPGTNPIVQQHALCSCGLFAFDWPFLTAVYPNGCSYRPDTLLRAPSAADRPTTRYLELQYNPSVQIKQSGATHSDCQGTDR